jgi:hypothetical protein
MLSVILIYSTTVRVNFCRMRAFPNAHAETFKAPFAHQPDFGLAPVCR